MFVYWWLTVTYLIWVVLTVFCRPRRLRLMQVITAVVGNVSAICIPCAEVQIRGVSWAASLETACTHVAVPARISASMSEFIV